MTKLINQIIKKGKKINRVFAILLVVSMVLSSTIVYADVNDLGEGGQTLFELPTTGTESTDKNLASPSNGTEKNENVGDEEDEEDEEDGTNKNYSEEPEDDNQSNDDQSTDNQTEDEQEEVASPSDADENEFGDVNVNDGNENNEEPEDGNVVETPKTLLGGTPLFGATPPTPSGPDEYTGLWGDCPIVITKISGSNYKLTVTGAVASAPGPSNPPFKDAALSCTNSNGDNFDDNVGLIEDYVKEVYIVKDGSENKVKAINCKSMFENVWADTWDLSGLDTSNCENFYQMFYETNLSSLPTNIKVTSNATNTGQMFEGCSELNTLDLSSFNTTNVTNMNNMLSGLTALTSIKFGANSLKGNTTDIGLKESVWHSSTVEYANTAAMLTAAKALTATETYTTGPLPTPTTYTVTFDTDGGSSVASQTVNAGGTATRPTDPTKSGFTFDNWYEESTHTNVFNFSTAINANKTLYAKWTASPTPTPTPVTPSGGGSSSSGGSTGVIPSIKTDNPIIQNTNDLTIANNPLAPENVTQVTRNASTDHVVNANTTSVNWVTDPATGKWKLNIGGSGSNSSSGTNASYGFYTIAKVTPEVDNNTGLNTVKTTVSTYYFDQSSLMHIGWLTTADLKTYYFETLKNNDEGKMISGWKDIDKKWYYFNGEGYMLRDTNTPDGYRVDVNGVWVR